MGNLIEEQIDAFAAYLQTEERSKGTIEKYRRDILAFSTWLSGREMKKETISAWKEELLERRYKPVTINSMLAAVNTFSQFTGRPELKVKYLRVQRQLFRSESKELTKTEYERLLQTASGLGKGRLALLMETICSTGMRVSEVAYLTVEAVCTGQVEISLKGKIRTILLPRKLCRKLLKYAKAQGIIVGQIFLTKNGTPMSRKQIWAEMKTLCSVAGVEKTKVFPHNLRHLFARMFYRISRDVVKLSDLLGHSSIETTRIYLISTGAEHVRQLERLGLVV